MAEVTEQEQPKTENGGKGGNNKERRGGGKGGRGEGKGGRPRKPRAEIPTFDDPEAELTKVTSGGEPKKPDRDALDRKIQTVQNDIEANKKRTEAITKDLDAIKEKNEKIKQQGASPLEKCREGLRELKKQIVGVIEERKRVSSSIDSIREKKSSMDDAIKKQKAAVGRFTSNEAIDEEIRRIEDYMAHNSIDLKTEKDCMVQIKELNKKRDEVKHLEVMEGKRSDGSSQSMSLPDLFEARKTVDGKLDALRAQEKEQVEAMNALREKQQNNKDSERFEKLLAERKVIREKISEKIGAIRDLRNEYQEADDKWFEHDRLVKNLKWQIRQKNIKEREERQKQWEEDKKSKQAEWEAEKEYRKNFDEDGNPREVLIDWDLAERITLCEQLVVFLKKYMPAEATEVVEKVVEDGRKVDKPTGVVAHQRNDTLADDPLGLNAFMVDEVVSKKSKKKDKKKKANASKNDEMLLVAEGEVVALQLSLEMIQQFATMGLAVPVNSEDCEGSVAQLLEKKAYYEAKGEEGLSLKDVLKAEKEGRKKGGKKDEPAKEEAKEEAPKEEFDLAALRKAAQGTQMTDEEKKARGLLYDTSKASAVRDDSEEDDEDDDSCAMMGGDPFEGL
jgi:hypothetical protein